MQAFWALWGCEPCQNWGWVSSRKLVYNRTAGLWRAQWSCALVVWIKTMAVKAGMVGVSSEWWMWWIWGRTTSSFTYTLQQGALRRHRIDNFAVSTCFSENFSICFYSYSVFRNFNFTGFPEAAWCEQQTATHRPSSTCLQSARWKTWRSTCVRLTCSQHSGLRSWCSRLSCRTLLKWMMND